MPITDRRAVRTAARVLAVRVLAVRVLAVPAATLAALATAAPPAMAHTELVTRTPPADATLTALPPDITLTFSDTMTERYAQLAVTGADGTPVGEGEPRVTGKTVRLDLPGGGGAPAGRYTVGYRVVSADGHPVAGSYAFEVREAGKPDAPEPPPLTPTPPALARTAEPPDADTGAGAGLLAGAVAASLAVIGGAVAYAIAVRRRRRSTDA
ncbi:copper resistance protein CopC [Streptomyces sp. NPDC059477]|uniref:copper resistance CopC family protein n=1 Tax=Streptomyces sp. NPDC059477 TaxID=3346847 RepID=UPI0036CDE89E